MKYMINLIKKGVRVFRPVEYEQLLKILSQERQAQLNGLLLSGMRYEEAKRLQYHPEWFDGKFIHLPKGASLKEKAHFDNRTIRLSNAGVLMIPNFIKTKKLPGSWEAWRKNLGRWAIRAGLDANMISVKSTRKTWESWLYQNYSTNAIYITLSQGHTGKTSTDHYVVDGFTELDKADMKKWVDGWI